MCRTPSLVSKVLFNLLPHLSSHFNSIFRHFDSDHSGSIEGSELTDALRQFGYNLSPQIIQLVVAKYGNIYPSTLSPLCFPLC